MIGHHQWLTLSACVLMWGPCLVERLFEMSKWSTQHYDNGIVVPKSGGSESGNNQGTLVELQSFIYRKVASSNTSCLEVHALIKIFLKILTS